ncbi:glycosyl hydrolase family 65 protein [Spiroplasma endosymbiont of Aspidapion aeneum]|uniref:glycosyl hydrolase family 65 protein n=1 Tax=Spiroplasma endosymbiont of Aspidapion aeneum TaxID=3066276 RepID=UPI00313D2F4E
MKTIKKTEFNKNSYVIDESIYTLTNGYIGMRGSFEEGIEKNIESIPGTYINAFYELIDITYAAKYTGYPDLYQRMMPVVDIQKIEIYIDGERFIFKIDNISNYNMTYDLETAEIIRSYTFSCFKKNDISFTFKKIISFRNYEMFYQDININTNFDKNHKIKIEFPLHYKDIEGDREIPNDISSSFSQFFNIDNEECNANTQSIVYKTKKSKSKYLFFSTVEGLEQLKNISSDHLIYEGEISKSPIKFIKKNVLYDEKYQKIEFKNKQKILNKIKTYSYEQLKNDNKKIITEFWDIADTRLVTEDPKIELYNNYNMFQVFANSGKLPWTSTPAKGLSGEGYGGHYFWDTEIYLINPLNLINPKLAKQLLLFRFNTLAAAKKIANTLGHQGAMYPWRTINGNETSTYYPAGTAQYHINGDIVYAFVNYYKITKDNDFLFKYAFDVIIETAKMWLDKVSIINGVGHINSVTGPDEYQIIVNDDFYTNCIAKYNLEWAHKVCRLLEKHDVDMYLKKKKELNLDENIIKEFKNCSNSICILYNNELKINPQHDNFLKRKVVKLSDYDNMRPLLRTMHPIAINSLQICKQADVVLAYMMHPKIVSKDIMIKSLRYYENIDTADSSLSKSIYSIMKARLSIDDFGIQDFIKNIYLDIENTHKNTHRGLHMASMGGTRMFIIYGLLGLSIEDDWIEIDPKVNDVIKGFQVKICYRDDVLEFDITNNKITIRNLTNKNDILIKYKEKDYHIISEVKINV